jgi:hypothetical protein
MTIQPVSSAGVFWLCATSPLIVSPAAYPRRISSNSSTLRLSGFIQKPYTAAQLAEKIKTVPEGA